MFFAIALNTVSVVRGASRHKTLGSVRVDADQVFGHHRKIHPAGALYTRFFVLSLRHVAVDAIVDDCVAQHRLHTAGLGAVAVETATGKERSVAAFGRVGVVATGAGQVVALLEAGRKAETGDLVVAMYADSILGVVWLGFDIFRERQARAIGEGAAVFDAGARMALRADLY